jgi:hypothetical protein
MITTIWSYEVPSYWINAVADIRDMSSRGVYAEAPRKGRGPMEAASIPSSGQPDEDSNDEGHHNEDPAPPASSARRSEANRKNAQRSTGPTSPAGKANSSRNATTHGAWARNLFPIERGPLAEDPDQLRALAEALLEEVGSKSVLVQELTMVFVRDLVRKLRVVRLEALSLAGDAARRLGIFDPRADNSEEGRQEATALHAVDLLLEKTSRINASVGKDLERSWRMLREAIAAEIPPTE